MKTCGLCGWTTSDDTPGMCERCGNDWWGLDGPMVERPPWLSIFVVLVIVAGVIAAFGMGVGL